MAPKKRQEIFNEELDSYLSSLRKKEPKPLFRTKNKKNDAPVYEEEYVDITKTELLEEADDEDFAPPRSFFSQLLDFFKAKRVPPEVMKDIEETKEEFAEQYEFLEKEEKEIREEEEEIERKKMGLLRSFLMRLNLIGSAKDDYIEAEADSYEGEELLPKQELDEVKEDMKELGKLATFFLRSVPPPHLKKLKQTEEFSRFKELLKKYGLIK